jgi:predicted RecA/RadA family phage recombinase
MAGTKLVDLSPIVSISPEDVFLVENVSETLSNSITYANLVSFISSSISVSSSTEWQSNSTTIINANSVNFTGSGVSVADIGGVATIDIPSGSSLTILDEGVELDTAATAINFVGAGVTTTSSANTTTVTIDGGLKSIINFTATAEQTVITVNYSITNVSVFIGGIKLRNDSYTATNGTSITLDYSLDLDTWISIETSTYIYSYTDFTATANQDTFAFAYVVGALEIFVSGVKLRDTDYTASNGTSIILNSPVSTDTWVQAIATS